MVIVKHGCCKREKLKGEGISGEKKSTHNEKLSLSPMSFEDALKKIVNAPPPKEKQDKKKTTTKRHQRNKGKKPDTPSDTSPSD